MTATLDQLRWNEPEGCRTPRGWLFNDALGACVGHYLDYGPAHYRAPDHPSRDHQPGNILADRYPNGRSAEPRESRYVETIADARAWIAIDDLARRYRRAMRALAAAELAELDGPLLEAFEIQAADAYARYVTATGTGPSRDHL